MGILGKIFGRKEQEEMPSFTKPEELHPFARQDAPEPEHWVQPSVPFQFQPQAQGIASSADKELQIISAKLDTLKAMLDDINNRLARLEKLAGEQTEEVRWR